MNKAGLLSKAVLSLVISGVASIAGTVQAETIVSSYEGEKVVQSFYPDRSIRSDQAHLPTVITATDMLTLEYARYWCKPLGNKAACKLI